MQPLSSLHQGDELVRGILDVVAGAVVHVTRDGSIARANLEAMRLLGLHLDELTKRYVAERDAEILLDDGSPCPPAGAPIAKVLATGVAHGPQTLGVRRDGAPVVWTVCRAVPLRDANGDLDGAVISFLDVTERKLAEDPGPSSVAGAPPAGIRATEQNWRALIDSLPDDVLIVDLDCTILSTNRTLGSYPRDHVIGARADRFIDESSAHEWRRQFAVAVATGAPARIDVRGRSAPGVLSWYESVLVPLKADGVVNGVMIVARDITERRALIAGLAEKERLASVGMVAASVAHEIMNPLTYVLANLDFALSDRQIDPARRTKMLADALEGAQRMQQIVWDLRSVGRPGGEELFYVDARTVLETALRLSGPEVGRTARVVLDLQEVPGVLASESRLCQVFINLLVNAAQSMDERPTHDREIHVCTRHDEEAGLVAVEISDKGTGIEGDRLERIFEPFYTTKGSGTGLGLSISRDIIERMGGRIAVESATDRGTTFTVWLSTTRRIAASSAVAE